jgi:hypothetical protein
MDLRWIVVAVSANWWCEENRQHPTLLRFHLRNSIFAHFHGSSEPEEFDDTEEED